MQEFEKLVLEVESKGMEKANANLDKLEEKAGAAEQAVTELKGASSSCDTTVDRMAKSLDALASEMKEASAGAKASTSALEANTAANLATATAIEAAILALTARAAATTTDATATVAATAAGAAHTVAATADTAATTSDTAATVANTAATVINTTATQVSTASWISQALAATRSAAATAVATVRQGAMATANYAYTASARVASTATSLLRANVVALYAKLAVLAVPLLAISQLVGATKEYQDFGAQLRVATKSAEGATEAYEALTEFASGTPYALNTATGAFIKLVNLGLTPGERALTSYGNTASAMGKDLDQMIEAVADAATFEFERLKEFGIRASKEGDQIRFTFQGVSTTVKATAADVESYLMGLGENQFAGAMEERMKTLGGVMSNLGDEWGKLLVNLSEAGAGDIITDAFKSALGAIEELNAMLSSGQLQAHISAYAGMWSTTFDEVKQDFESVTRDVETGTSEWGSFVDTAVDVMQEGLAYFPINVKTTMEVVGAYLYRLVEYGRIASKTAIDVMKNEFDRLVNIASATMAKVRLIMTGAGDTFDLGAAITGYNDAATQIREGILANAAAEKETLASLTDVQGILDARDEKINALKAEHAEAEELRKAYELIQHVRKAQDGDRLAKFKTGGGATGETPGATGGGGGGGGDSSLRQTLGEELTVLEEGLLREDEVLSAAYEKRKGMILESTALTEQEKRDMSMMALTDSILTEEEAIQEAYDRRRDLILSATQLTEDQRTELMKRSTETREKALEDIEAKRFDDRLKGASNFFGNLASMGEAFGKKGFAIAKAAAIAETIVNTASAAMKAYKDGGAYLGPAFAAAAVAAGAAQIATISATQYQGRYEHGGMISAGRYGLVGEAGPEFVQGPAIVSSAVTSASKRDEGGIRSVVVNNYGAPVSAETSQNGDQLLVILKPLLAQTKREVKAELAQEIRSGGGQVSSSMERTFRLNRGAS